MSIGSFLVAFFLIGYLRNALQTSTQLPKWDKILVTTRYAIIALLVIEVVFSLESVTTWIWHALLLVMAGTIFWQSEFRAVRTLLYAVVPYILVSLLSDLIEVIDPEQYESWDSYIGSAIFFAFVWMFAMWLNTRKQQKALEKERQKTKEEAEHSRIIELQRDELDRLVNERTAELTQQKEELQQALTELKATQAQLIQREKLASLGELTAGIAHEIQNPLNFVTNFAEASEGLCEELREELEKGNTAEVPVIVDDLKQNLERIQHHGKRADSIVKGMLQHSRASSGERQLSDINALADEYLRLSYHGLRAKNKSFNAALVTDFDPKLGKVEVVPQDLGRVLLNLFNNAFYAVHEKSQMLQNGYRPEVKVSTKAVGNKLEIRIRDNGTGMSETVKQKLFQPFFTTKPTGEGTGLGLSLSYDIVTKIHGGEMNVATKEGEYAEFTIRLPMKINTLLSNSE